MEWSGKPANICKMYLELKLACILSSLIICHLNFVHYVIIDFLISDLTMYLQQHKTTGVNVPLQEINLHSESNNCM